MIGLEPGKMLVQADTAAGEAALKTLGFAIETDSEAAQKRQAALTKFAAEVKERRKKFFAKTQ